MLIGSFSDEVPQKMVRSTRFCLRDISHYLLTTSSRYGMVAGIQSQFAIVF